MQRSAIVCSSARESTRPVGLCGVLTRIARVRGVTAAASSSASNVHDGGCSGTGTSRAPVIFAAAP